ncbi:hypothetical protein CFIICLFH_4730 [Methylobacterium goesingense]|jgi:hypothetical protein|uniref:Uncharacterized protein n=1 Tax=Methylobacterium goesingense TaxID=243690 RepID=A0ABV2LBT7_9HYPH|nr:hypothetical protein CFIICLFH_4730 [Methylobacterium goesingense]
MLTASENLVIQHREIVAILVTYALFFAGVIAMAWLIA